MLSVPLSPAGSDLLHYIQTEMDERVAVVISADLAHTHLKSGPYGYSNASEPFDLVTHYREGLEECVVVPNVL